MEKKTKYKNSEVTSEARWRDSSDGKKSKKAAAKSTRRWVHFSEWTSRVCWLPTVIAITWKRCRPTLAVGGWWRLQRQRRRFGCVLGIIRESASSSPSRAWRCDRFFGRPPVNDARRIRRSGDKKENQVDEEREWIRSCLVTHSNLESAKRSSGQWQRRQKETPHIRTEHATPKGRDFSPFTGSSQHPGKRYLH